MKKATKSLTRLLVMSLFGGLTVQYAEDKSREWVAIEYRCEMLNPHEINEIRKNPISTFLETAEDFGHATLYPTCEKRNAENAKCAAACKEDAVTRMRIALAKKKDERICGVI
jgi:hypothetical protein